MIKRCTMDGYYRLLVQALMRDSYKRLCSRREIRVENVFEILSSSFVSFVVCLPPPIVSRSRPTSVHCLWRLGRKTILDNCSRVRASSHPRYQGRRIWWPPNNRWDRYPVARNRWYLSARYISFVLDRSTEWRAVSERTISDSAGSISWRTLVWLS